MRRPSLCIRHVFSSSDTQQLDGATGMARSWRLHHREAAKSNQSSPPNASTALYCASGGFAIKQRVSL